MPHRTVRIGCASGFWGDSSAAAPQLLADGVDYIVFDFLAEITMSILARARARSAQAGYASDFVDPIVAQMIAEVARRGTRLVSNAGGVNPLACAEALRAAARKAGVPVKVAAVLGDDLLERREELAGCREMFTGAPMPKEGIASMNAYLGATPIAAALDEGAQIVVTGRCVDSALVLGPLMHEFGWRAGQFDLLAAGSLAGHLLECGPQATGGLFTDWQSVPGWEDMGYPVAECASDGSFVITKPCGTGGMVTPATVAEQLLYEIGDPAAYLLPDVTCDLREVRLEQAGPDRVRVTGVRGRPPTDSYKVCATYADGYRSTATLTIIGFDAVAKARRTAEALLARMRRLLAERGMADFQETSIEVLGAEDSYGPHARHAGPREVVLKLAARHPDREAMELFSREIAPAATSMAQGTTGFFAGRPGVSPVLRLFSFLVPKSAIAPSLAFDDARRTCPGAACGGFTASTPRHDTPPLAATGETIRFRLLDLAHGRSGDKGDTANIGLIARKPEYWPVLRDAVTAQFVAERFSHFLGGPVERYELPGVRALNFLLHRSLGGGGIASLRIDPQGKSYAQMLLDAEVAVPKTFAARQASETTAAL